MENGRSVQLGEWSLFWLQGFLLGLLCSVHSIVEFFCFGNFTPYIFSDWDEPFYVASARDSYLAFQQSPSSLLYQSAVYPHMITDVLIGALLSLWPGCETFWLVFFDVLLVTLTYVLLSTTLIRLGASRAAARFGVLILIVLPREIFPRYFFTIPLPERWDLTSAYSPGWSYHPLFRAFHTQISWIPFLLCFSLLAKVVSSGRYSCGAALRLGMWAGVTLYAYFYGWAVLGGLVPTFLLLAPRVSGRGFDLAEFPRKAKEISFFFLSFLCVSLPGLWVIAQAPLTDNMKILDGLPRVWFLSLEDILVIFLILYFLSRHAGSRFVSLASWLLVSLLIVDLVLPNFQPLLQRLLYPYHFNVFYLAPLFGALVGALFWDLLPGIFISPGPRRIARAFLFLGPLCFLSGKAALAITSHFGEEVVTKDTVEEAENRAVLATIPTIVGKSESVLSAPCDEDSQIGYWLFALFGIQTPMPYYALNLSSQERTLATKFIKYILEEQDVSLPDCEDPRKFPLSYYFTTALGVGHTFAVTKYARGWCNDPTAVLDSCEYLSKHKVDYVLWSGKTKPSWFAEQLTFLWKSPAGHYELYRWTPQMSERICRATQ